jgi:hypothetical protein
MINLYSRRFSIFRGWQWKHERICTNETANTWLIIFERDEPDIEFKLSVDKPTI